MNIQLNIPFSDYTRFRYGLYKSSPGIGMDVGFQEIPFITSFSIYEFGDPYLDIVLKYSLLDYLSINTGYNEINKDTRTWLMGFSIIPDSK